MRLGSFNTNDIYFISFPQLLDFLTNYISLEVNRIL